MECDDRDDWACPFTRFDTRFPFTYNTIPLRQSGQTLFLLYLAPLPIRLTNPIRATVQYSRSIFRAFSAANQSVRSITAAVHSITY